MDSSRVWYRTFTRGAKPEEPDQPLDDIDTVADNDFIQSHFTDKFGQWLTQGNNKVQGTLDGLLSVFFRTSAKAKSFHPESYKKQRTVQISNYKPTLLVMALPFQRKNRPSGSNLICGLYA